MPVNKRRVAMKRIVAVVAVILFGYAGIVCAADDKTNASEPNIGEKTVAAVTDTAKSAVSGTANIAQTSVADTAASPTTAIQAVKDTANTALDRTDAAIKTFTGEDSNK
jgi:hypothetical protein